MQHILQTRQANTKLPTKGSEVREALKRKEKDKQGGSTLSSSDGNLSTTRNITEPHPRKQQKGKNYRIKSDRESREKPAKTEWVQWSRQVKQKTGRGDRVEPMLRQPTGNHVIKETIALQPSCANFQNKGKTRQGKVTQQILRPKQKDDLLETMTEKIKDDGKN